MRMSYPAHKHIRCTLEVGQQLRVRLPRQVRRPAFLHTDLAFEPRGFSVEDGLIVVRMRRKGKLESDRRAVSPAPDLLNDLRQRGGDYLLLINGRYSSCCRG